MPTGPSESAYLLAVVMVAACIACLILVFQFGRTLQMAGYLRNIIVDSVKRQELDRLLRQLTDEASTHPLDPADLPPPEFGPLQQLYTADPAYVGQGYKFRFGPPPGPPYGPVETEEAKKKREETYTACRNWEIKERKRFEDQKKDREGQARKSAEDFVPKSMDISLLGGGWSFLLEFSTVIVIIFTLLILGVLGFLEGQQIAPILAAIAGYVLGKATSAVTAPTASTTTITTPAAASATTPPAATNPQPTQPNQ